MDWKTVVVVLLVVLFVIITIQNTEVASFSFLFWQIHMSRIVMLLITFVIGVVAGYALAFVGRRKSRQPEKEI